jgi:hypothetical protein
MSSILKEKSPDNQWISAKREDQRWSNNDKFRPLTLQSLLNLKKGDQVWVVISGLPSFTDLFSSSFSRANLNVLCEFTGFMLEEKIVASL